MVKWSDVPPTKKQAQGGLSDGQVLIMCVFALCRKNFLQQAVKNMRLSSACNQQLNYDKYADTYALYAKNSLWLKNIFSHWPPL